MSSDAKMSILVEQRDLSPKRQILSCQCPNNWAIVKQLVAHYSLGDLPQTQDGKNW
jgi:hypothetical protein